MLFSSLSLLAFVLSVAGFHDGVNSRPRMVHQNVARRPQVNLHKRYSSTRWSFYDVGLGACGKTNVNSDFIVALNSEQFGSGYPGTHCFKPITLTYKGKTATATIMDSCPGCPYGGLDLSRGLFKYFASEDEGIIYGDWSFADGVQEATTTTQHTVAAVTISTPNATLPTIIAAAGAAPSKNATNTGDATPVTSATSENVPSGASSSAIKVTVKPSASSVPQVSANASPSATATSSSAISSSLTASSPPSTFSSSTVISTSNPTTTAPVSSSTATNYIVSMAAVKSSVANIASSFSSVAPSPTGSAGAAFNVTNTNTTALIEDHLEAINVLLADLEKMIAAAGLRRDQD